MKEKWLGIDYGESRIGLALSDDLLLYAHPLETISCKKGKDKAYERIIQLAKEKKVTGIVLGKPQYTHSELASESQKKAQFLGDMLQESLQCELVYQDERFTTVLAHQYLRASGKKEKAHKDVVDQVAAQIILQDFLDRKRKMSHE